MGCRAACKVSYYHRIPRGGRSETWPPLIGGSRRRDKLLRPYHARLGQCCEAAVGRPTQADFSCETPVLEIARRLDAASLPSRCSNCVARRRPWQPRRRWPWGAVRQGPSARVGSGSSVSAAGSPTSSSATEQTHKRRGREGYVKGPSVTP